jgi:hypothetical protein
MCTQSTRYICGLYERSLENILKSLLICVDNILTVGTIHFISFLSLSFQLVIAFYYNVTDHLNENPSQSMPNLPQQEVTHLPAYVEPPAYVELAGILCSRCGMLRQSLTADICQSCLIYSTTLISRSMNQ